MDKNREFIDTKDERVAQLERQLRELNEAQQQVAATIARQNSRTFNPLKGIFKSFSKAARLKIILAMVILTTVVVLTSLVMVLNAGTFKKDSGMFVEHVQELATLATAKAQIKAVIHEEDTKNFLSINLPGTKREVLLIVPATVVAGVDLKGVTSEDMVINEETKEIDITLPRAELIQEPSIQMDKIQIFDNVGLFRSDIKMGEGFERGAEAQEIARLEAISGGLLETAEKNAEKVLKEFFKNIGYTVKITFN